LNFNFNFNFNFNSTTLTLIGHYSKPEQFCIENPVGCSNPHTYEAMSVEEDRARKHLEAGEREAAKLWRAWKTVHEMVQDRGYELTDEEVKITLEDFKTQFTGADGSIEYVSRKHCQLFSY
jgi:hypothetical protein